MNKLKFMLMVIAFVNEAYSGDENYTWILKIYTKKSFETEFSLLYLLFDNRTDFDNKSSYRYWQKFSKQNYSSKTATRLEFSSPKSLGQVQNMEFVFSKLLEKNMYKATVQRKGTNWMANLTNSLGPGSRKRYIVNGCQSTKVYGINCDKKCICRKPGDTNLRWCDGFSGRCAANCPPGWKSHNCAYRDKCKRNRFGTFCQKKCHCDGDKGCHIDTGRCHGRRCQVGFVGKTCQRCQTNVWGENCNRRCYCAGQQGCNQQTGKCLGGKCVPGRGGDDCKPCSFGTYGTNCLKKCNCYANITCNAVNGSCGVHGCPLGFGGDNCQTKRDCPKGHFGKACIKCGHCKAICRRSKCLASCHPKSGKCLSGKCERNFIGPQCLQCKADKYGGNCQFTCGHCASRSCHLVTGHCDFQHCLPGYLGMKCDQECAENKYGLNCLKSCSENCVGKCNKVNGFCSPCKQYWKGRRCDEPKYVCPKFKYGITCDKKCGKCVNGEVCGQDGLCSNGCAEGFYGPKCISGCNPGSFGRNCVESCGACKNWEACDTVSGNCKNGCIGYFIKPKCQVCATGFYGHECSDKCGHCKDNASCDPVSGACEDGCAPQYSGHFCTERKSGKAELKDLVEDEL